jgi:hypothetical protein
LQLDTLDLAQDGLTARLMLGWARHTVETAARQPG